MWWGGAMSQGAPLGGGDAALGLASFNTVCASVFALGLLLRLDGAVALPWGGIFAPFLLGHVTAASVHAVKRRLHMRASVDVNPSTMLVRVRDSQECLYKLLQSCGVISSCGLLIAAIMMGPPSDASASDSTAPVIGLSYSLICLPIWLAWAAETWVWLKYRKYRNGAIQGGLTPNHSAIKIRGHDEIFFYNLMVTLVVRMLDGAYSCTWMTLFTVVWVQLLLIAVLYVICFVICLIGLGLSHTQRFQPALAAYRKVFLKSLLLVTFGSTTVVLYYMFWHNLARRMDGEESVTHVEILAPLIIKVGPELLSSFILYTTGGHTTIHDSIRSTTEEGERVQWEREKEEYAAIAPKRLVQQSATFFKAAEPGMGGASELRLREAGGRSGNGASNRDQPAGAGQTSVQAGAPPGGVWDKSFGGGTATPSPDAPEPAGEQEGRLHLSATSMTESKARGDEDSDGRTSRTNESSTAGNGEGSHAKPPPVSEGWGQGGGGTGDNEGNSDDGSRECDICLSAPREVALLPCGHGGMCAACAHASVELPGHSCPICRQKVLMVAELQPDDDCDVESVNGCGPSFVVVRRERASTPPSGDATASLGRSATAVLSQHEP